MGICFKCALSFIYFILNYESIHGYSVSSPSAVYGLQTVRSKRQAGYVYNRPSISFDLPTRNSIVPTSTQASPVDRISMQMFYAYPAPAERNMVKIGYTETGTTSTSTRANTGSTGYNYDLPIIQSGSTGNVVAGGTSGSSDYNYAVQNTESQNTQSGNVGTVATGDSSLGGYNYGVQNTAVENVQSVSVGSVGNSGSPSSSGYNYGVQNTEIQVTSGQNTQSEVTGVSTGSTGYNYGTQNNVGTNAETDIATKTGGSGYSSQTTTQTTNAGISTSEISTNAPKYLPPSNMEVTVINSAINTQTGSPNVAPSETYLPPSVLAQNTPVTVQTVSNDATQISKLPSPSYLAPNILANTQIIQTQTAVTSTNRPQQGPVQNYLLPTAQGSIQTPASSYLPPVF